MEAARRVSHAASDPQASSMRSGTRGRLLLMPLILAVVSACQDTTAPLGPADPQFAKQPLKTVWTVTSLDDPGVTNGCGSDYCTLRQAIGAAQAGDKIVFKSNLIGTIALTTGELQIDKDLKIEGAGRIAVDAQGAGNVFTTSAAVILDGLTITGSGGTGNLNVPNSAGIVNLGGALTINNTTISDNLSRGISNALSTGVLTITNSTIANSGLIVAAGIGADVNGGGIYNAGTLTLTTSTLSNNRATTGGGIYDIGSATITRSTISGNRVSSSGGAIYSFQGEFVVRSSTIAGNFASLGGGVTVSEGATGSLANSVVAGNMASSGFPDCWTQDGTITSLGHNLVGDCPANGAGDVVVTAGQVFTEVLEAQLNDNGGPTKTHALLERGRAVDAGYCPGESTDQRGFARPFDDSRMPNALDGCDIGAFEWRPATSTGPGKGPKK